MKFGTKLNNKFNKCQTKPIIKTIEGNTTTANLRQKAKSEYFESICKNGILDSKALWQRLKPYFFGEGRSDSDICLLEKDSLFTDPTHIAEIMNNSFLSVGKQSLTDHMNIEPHSSIDNIAEKYKNNSSTKNIKRN